MSVSDSLNGHQLIFRSPFADKVSQSQNMQEALHSFDLFLFCFGSLHQLKGQFGNNRMPLLLSKNETTKWTRLSTSKPQAESAMTSNSTKKITEETTPPNWRKFNAWRQSPNLKKPKEPLHSTPPKTKWSFTRKTTKKQLNLPIPPGPESKRGLPKPSTRSSSSRNLLKRTQSTQSTAWWPREKTSEGGAGTMRTQVGSSQQTRSSSRASMETTNQLKWLIPFQWFPKTRWRQGSPFSKWTQSYSASQKSKQLCRNWALHHSMPCWKEIGKHLRRCQSISSLLCTRTPMKKADSGLKKGKKKPWDQKKDSMHWANLKKTIKSFQKSLKKPFPQETRVS